MNRHQFHRRVWGSVFGLALVLLWLGSALYDVQVVQGPSLAARGNHIIQESETVEAARGQILERYGRAGPFCVPYGRGGGTHRGGLSGPGVFLRLG